jgi:TonB family protein
MTDSAHDLVIGTVLDGRYQIVRELGRGGMSTVYLAEHALIGRLMAAKVLHAEVARSAESVARFMAEARTVGTLGHPNVVSSTDMGYLPDGRPYLILEYLEGWTLAEELESVATLPYQRAVHIAMQIASGVGAAHDRGIVHRDLKSDNIFLAQTEHAADHVKILDFGISKFLETPLETGQTQRGIILGTPEFMAPEQIHSPELVDHRADIYALGTILHHMLSGRTPFENTPAPKLWNRILHEMPRPVALPGVPGQLTDLVQRLLAKDPADRPQSMLALFDELAPFGYQPGTEHLSAPRISRPPTMTRPRALPLAAGPTPVPGAAVMAGVEPVGARQPGTPPGHVDPAADARPRTTSPRGGLPAPGQMWSPPPMAAVTPGGSPLPHPAQRPTRDTRPPSRRAAPPTILARGTPGARRRARLYVLMVLLLGAGAGAGVWLMAVLTGARTAAPATTDTTTPPASATAPLVAAGTPPPATTPAVVVGQGAGVDTLDDENRAAQGQAGATGPRPVAAGDGEAAAAGNDEPEGQIAGEPGNEPENGNAEAAEDELAEGAEDEDARERRRRRRERRRDSSSSQAEEGRDQDTSGRAGDAKPATETRTPAEPDRATTPAITVTRPDTARPETGVGRVDPEDTRRMVRARLGEIRTCHERGRMDEPGLSGRVVVRIGIGRGGRVTSATIASSTLGAPSVEKCITSAVQKWTLPAPAGGATAVIEYPFVLK